MTNITGITSSATAAAQPARARTREESSGGTDLVQRLQRVLPGSVFDSMSGLQDNPDLLRRLQAARQQLAQRGGPLPGQRAQAAPDTDKLIVVEQRAQLALLQDTTRYRATQIHENLPRRDEFTKGAELPSFKQTKADPMAVQPKSRDEARALGERMTIDMVEGVAELDVIGADIAAAKHDLNRSPGQNPAAADKVAKLEQHYRAQHSYLDRLMEAYEKHTGKDASLTGATDTGAPESAQKQAQEVAGLRDAAVEEATTGESERVNAARNALVTSFIHAADTATRSIDRMVDDSRRERAESDSRNRKQLDAAVTERRAMQRKLNQRR